MTHDDPAVPPRGRLVDADRVWPGDGLAPWREISGHLVTVGATSWLSIELFNLAYWKTTPTDTLCTGYRKRDELGC